MNNNMQDALRRLQQDPKSLFTQAGVNVPDNLIGDPQAMVMHLLQTGQVGGAAFQRVLPMLRQMSGK